MADLVKVGGAVISAILHEAVREQGDVEGLLYGMSALHHEHATIDDANDGFEGEGGGAAKQRCETTLHSFVRGVRGPECDGGSFYAADGSLDLAALAALNRAAEQSHSSPSSSAASSSSSSSERTRPPVVGWFVTRTNAPAARPTLRDVAVHRRLCAWHSGGGGGGGGGDCGGGSAAAADEDAEPFVLLLVTPGIDAKGATQSVQYQCLQTRRDGGARAAPTCFEGVALQVRNLTHDSAAE